MELAGHATMAKHGVAVDSSVGIQSRHGRKKALTGRSRPSAREKGQEVRGAACAGLGRPVQPTGERAAWTARPAREKTAYDGNQAELGYSGRKSRKEE